MKQPDKKNTHIWISTFFLAIILTAGIIFHVNTFHKFHDWGPDFAKYIGQAVSLIDGKNILDLFAESGEYAGFPWGFSFLLAPVYSIWGLNLNAFKITVTLYYIASLPVIYFLFRKKISALSRYLIIGIFLTSPWFFYFKNNILSDFPYLCFSMMSILTIQEFIVNRNFIINQWLSYLLIGFVIGFTMLIRTQGVVLLPTLIIVQFITWRSRNTATSILSQLDIREIIPVAVAGGLYMTITILLPQGNEEYFELFMDNLHLKSVLLNVKYYFLIPESFIGGSDIQKVTYGMTIPLFLFGLIRNLKENYLYFIYSLISIFILVFWPYQQGIRFIISLLPFYFYFVFLCLESLQLRFKRINIKRFQKYILPLIAGIWIIFVMGLDLKYFYQTLDGRRVDGPYTEQAQQVFKFIREDTPENAVVMFRRAPVISLYTHRKTIKEAGNLKTLLSSSADYYLYYKKLSNAELALDIENNPQDFDLVYRNEDFQLYKIQH